MPRIHTPALESATGPTAEVYAAIKKKAGGVPNTYAAIGALGPQALKAILEADGVLASGTLSRQDQETIKLVVSTVVECHYCIAAHSLLGKMTGLSQDALRQIRAGVSTGGKSIAVSLIRLNMLVNTVTAIARLISTNCSSV